MPRHARRQRPRDYAHGWAIWAFWGKSNEDVVTGGYNGVSAPVSP